MTIIRIFIVSLCFVLPLFSGVENVCKADEPSEKFLEALLDNEYYDIAIAYLSEMEKSDLISDEFRQALPFEKAQVLIKSAPRIRDVDKLEARLDEAEKLLTQFSSNTDSPLIAAKSNQYRGDLRRNRSKLYARRAKSDRATADEKKQFIEQSREMLKLALKDFEMAREALKSTIKDFKLDVADPNSANELKKLRNSYTRIRLNLPVVKEQLCDTYPDESPRRKRLLTECVGEYTKLYDDYRRFAAGLDSCLFAARCQQKLGNHADALNLLKEIFALENTSALKTLKKRALLIAAPSWSSQSPYPHAEVIKQCAPLIDVLGKQELRQRDWLRVQMELAVAYYNRGLAEKEAGGPGASAKTKESHRLAAKLMRIVSRSPGELRDLATGYMKKWEMNVREVATDAGPPSTFIDARMKGQDIVGDIELLMKERSSISSKIRLASDQSQKDQLESELAQKNLQIKEQANSALSAFDLALELADEKTSREDLNKLRYLQSICYFAMQNYFETAIIGEYLLDRYPTINWTRQASTLVVRSYTSLYESADKDDRAEERERLAKICDSVSSLFPDSSESGTAAATLARLALDENNFADAEKHYLAIPEDYGSRSALGMRMGQKLWFSYLRERSSGSEEAKQLLGKAKTYLSQGVNASSTSRLGYDGALSSLLLVDAHLDSGEVDKAVSRLESEAIAPLDLIKQKHEAVMGSREAVYKREAYKTAVRTYLAAMKQPGDQEQWVNKALGVIAAMRDDPETANQMDSVYRRIAKGLLEQFEGIVESDSKQQFATGIASFLGAIEKDSQDGPTILWSGKTLLRLANSLTDQGLDSTALFQQAVSALNRAESVGFKGPDAALRTESLKWQRALAERGSGNYQSSIDQFVEILKARAEKGQKPILDIQVDAAETIHLAAKANKSTKGFGEAVGGIFPFKNPKTKKTANLVWGWKKLVGVTRNPKLKSTYIKCMYHLIDARYQYGTIKNSQNAVKAARKELDRFMKAEPGLGGPAWKPKFEELKKQIN